MKVLKLTNSFENGLSAYNPMIILVNKKQKENSNKNSKGLFQNGGSKCNIKSEMRLNLSHHEENTHEMIETEFNFLSRGKNILNSTISIDEFAKDEFTTSLRQSPGGKGRRNWNEHRDEKACDYEKNDDFSQRVTLKWFRDKNTRSTTAHGYRHHHHPVVHKKHLHHDPDYKQRVIVFSGVNTPNHSSITAINQFSAAVNSNLNNPKHEIQPFNLDNPKLSTDNINFNFMSSEILNTASGEVSGNISKRNSQIEALNTEINRMNELDPKQLRLFKEDFNLRHNIHMYPLLSASTSNSPSKNANFRRTLNLNLSNSTEKDNQIQRTSKVLFQRSKKQTQMNQDKESFCFQIDGIKRMKKINRIGSGKNTILNSTTLRNTTTGFGVHKNQTERGGFIVSQTERRKRETRRKDALSASIQESLLIKPCKVPENVKLTEQKLTNKKHKQSQNLKKYDSQIIVDNDLDTNLLYSKRENSLVTIPDFNAKKVISRHFLIYFFLDQSNS